MRKKTLKVIGLAMTLAFGITSYSQICTNTNGDLETFGGTVQTAPWLSNDWINDSLVNWFSSHGTPTPGTTPSTNMWMWSRNSRGEGVYTNHTFISGNTYIISYELFRATSADPTSTFRLELSNGLTPYSGGSTALPTVSGNQILPTQDWSSAGTTVIITDTITASANYSQLWLYPFLVNVATPETQALARIDDICISLYTPDPCDFTPSFSPRQDVCIISFEDTSTPPSGFTLLKTTWDFGDGYTATGSAVDHTFLEGGIYTVCMTLWGVDDRGNCCQQTICRDVEVRDCDPCRMSNFVRIGVSGSNPFEFTVTGIPTSMYDYYVFHWDYGDGQTENGSTVNHTYARGGSYLVCLTIYYFDPISGECCNKRICIRVVAKWPVIIIIDDPKDDKVDGDRAPVITEEPFEVENSPKGINIYPNPSDGKFNLQLKNGTVKTVSVYDQAGKKVLNATNTSDNDIYILDMIGFDKGLYVVVVNEEDEMNMTFSKVIID